MSNQEIHELAQQVADLLAMATKESWQYKAPAEPGDLDHWAHVTLACGYDLSLCFKGKRYGDMDRISVSGRYPRSKSTYYSPRDCMPYGERDKYKDPDITVATSRGLDTLVREITNRFLPPYRAAYAAVAKRVKENDDYESGKRETAERLAAALGIELRREYDGTIKPVLYPHGCHVYHLQIDSADSVRFELRSLSAELAIEVLNLVKSRETKKEAA